MYYTIGNTGIILGVVVESDSGHIDSSAMSISHYALFVATLRCKLTTGPENAKLVKTIGYTNYA